MKTFSHLWQYLSKFFLEWEVFNIQIVQKIKTRILCLPTFISEKKKPAVYEIMCKKYGAAREAADGNAACVCMLGK